MNIEGWLSVNAAIATPYTKKESIWLTVKININIIIPNNVVGPMHVNVNLMCFCFLLKAHKQLGYGPSPQLYLRSFLLKDTTPSIFALSLMSKCNNLVGNVVK